MIRGVYQDELGHASRSQVQILSPYRSTGDASANSLNAAIQAEVNPPTPDKLELASGGRLFRLGDRVMQTKNDYDIVLLDRNGEQIAVGIFNGEVGIVSRIQPGTLTVCFDGRYADYPLESLGELELAYATTIHKSQGSEYETVIVPMLPAHRILLSRNLFYTAVTRAKRRVILVGMKRAIHMAVGKCSVGKRNTLLGERIGLYFQAMREARLPGQLKKAG